MYVVDYLTIKKMLRYSLRYSLINLHIYKNIAVINCSRIYQMHVQDMYIKTLYFVITNFSSINNINYLHIYIQ